jgi:phenylalanyl-tRNA synthetase alpha chain
MNNLLNNIDQEYSNIPKSVIEKMNRNLYLIHRHPLEIIKTQIYNYFKTLRDDWVIFENLDKVVSVENNFDKLLIPQTHPSRSKSDTYYLNPSIVLRTHTSAHQTELLAQGYGSFLVCGDVYRRDEVDCCHYNIFHQLEGVLLFDESDSVDLEKLLVKMMEGLCGKLFPGCEYRVKSDYFPFTNPSWEIEVNYNSKWLEILGCGV